MKKLMLAALALSATMGTPVTAAVVLGNTTGGPTFNRPLTLTTLSGVGTAVPYQVTPFTVTAPGAYAFVMTTTGAYDPFLLLYQTAFNAGSPLVNILALNDDDPTGNFNRSAFTFALLTGVSYFAVATGFDNTDFGAYRLEITGPGNVVIGGTPPGAVPEPTTWAMIMAGFAIVGGALRRRRRRATVAFA